MALHTWVTLHTSMTLHTWMALYTLMTLYIDDTTHVDDTAHVEPLSPCRRPTYLCSINSRQRVDVDYQHDGHSGRCRSWH